LTGAWILQEVIIAKQVTFLGCKKSATWPVFQVAIEVAIHTDHTVEKLINTALQLDPSESNLWPSLKRCSFGITSARRNKTGVEITSIQSSQAIIFWLRISQEKSCMFQQDKIYSVLGLIPFRVRAMVEPNYSLPHRKVYSQLVEAFALGKHSLNIICHSEHTDTQDDQFPSWIPDWRRKQRLFPFIDLFSDSYMEPLHTDILQQYPHIFSENYSRMSV
jgi:hypothetical protein